MRRPDSTLNEPTLFIDPSSLGYAIQGVSILEGFLSAGKTDLIVEADERLVPLFKRSYYSGHVRFLAADKNRRDPLPNGGKPDREELHRYFFANAGHLANRLNIDDCLWRALLRPEIAPPFNAFAPEASYISAPRPGYLIADECKVADGVDYLSQDGALPVLINWNKGFSQHGDAAQQNLDANDIAFVIREIHRTIDAKLAFYNAVTDGPRLLTNEHYDQVNDQLKEDGIALQPIIDPKTNEAFELGEEIDRYAALMSAAKGLGGAMIGVGNSYQHLWYAVRSDSAESRIDQVVVLPHGDFPTKPAWELQAAQPGSPTITVSKAPDFDADRSFTLRNIALQTRYALKL